MYIRSRSTHRDRDHSHIAVNKSNANTVHVDPHPAVQSYVEDCGDRIDIDRHNSRGIDAAHLEAGKSFAGKTQYRGTAFVNKSLHS